MVKVEDSMYAEPPISQSDLAQCFNTEPALEDLLADPIAELLMSSDRVSRAHLRQLLARARAGIDPAARP